METIFTKRQARLELAHYIADKWKLKKSYAKARNVTPGFISNTLSGIDPMPDWMLEDLDLSEVKPESYYVRRIDYENLESRN
ncbi:MAG: hypothetical protein V3U78_04575 [Thiotrichaceae bacterium]